ncbi:cyclase family protein [Rhodanobacter lindaniclasticus]|uniref:Cyclase n=1 Tax=Rhodanobacter lindaniclasticus TaxID=75310 RepID=A0A4S3K981_9GAMM|nr:cyclase family protein [Rhodanobacter lindaniclasticus]THD04835.1 cyclase [Rhodanobacter lindaniclasticus]
MSRSTEEHRVCFDFEVDFSNGGGIQGQGFRLDIDGDDIDDQALADYIVRDMQLLMVGAVRIRNKKIIRERHKRQPQAAPSNALRPDLIDLSHVVHSGEEVYPGLPAPRVSDHLSHQASVGRYAEGVTFQIARIDMVANSGTAIDAPSHRYPGATDVAHLALGDIADVDAVVVHLQGMQGRSIDRAALASLDVRGRAVLLDTGWAAHWGTPAYLQAQPFLSRDGAEYLRDHGAVLVGIDALNIDDTGDPQRPAHSILLAASIPIVENLASLAPLPAGNLRFSAVPMRIAGMGTFPVRAWARLG